MIGGGAAGFNVMGLQTAAREGVDITVIVCAEGSWTMQELNELQLYGTTCRRPGRGPLERRRARPALSRRVRGSHRGPRAGRRLIPNRRADAVQGAVGIDGAELSQTPFPLTGLAKRPGTPACVHLAWMASASVTSR